jgi:hypothetical protein
MSSDWALEDDDAGTCRCTRCSQRSAEIEFEGSTDREAHVASIESAATSIGGSASEPSLLRRTWTVWVSVPDTPRLSVQWEDGRGSVWVTSGCFIEDED